MSHADITKHIFSNKFKELLQQMDFDKVYTNDIITASGYSNRTFYYHFKDKHDLIVWMYLDEMARLLKAAAKNNFKYLENNEKIICDPVFNKPFYILYCKETEAIFNKYWNSIANYFYNEGSFFLSAFHSQCQNNLRDYLLDLFKMALKKEIIIYLHDHHDQAYKLTYKVDLIANYFSRALVDTSFLWIEEEGTSVKSTNTPIIPAMTRVCLEFIADSLCEAENLKSIASTN